MTLAPDDRGIRPVDDADPFGPEILQDPLPFQERLREAGPVVHLSRYDVYGMGRYEQVHAALTDWQRFESSAGVGLANFRVEKPWRPPSLLLEADPPHHDAPRQVLEPILTPRALRDLRPAWLAAARELVDRVLGEGPIDLIPAIAQAFPLQVFPDAMGLPADGRENLLPYGDHAFNAFGPPNELVEKGCPASGRSRSGSATGAAARPWRPGDSEGRSGRPSIVATSPPIRLR